MTDPRTPAKKKARQFAKSLRAERPDYTYLKRVFYHLRLELGLKCPEPLRNYLTSPARSSRDVTLKPVTRSTSRKGGPMAGETSSLEIRRLFPPSEAPPCWSRKRAFKHETIHNIT